MHYCKTVSPLPLYGIFIFMNTVKQSEFLQAVESGKNIFLTGKAGTGKTHITKEAIKILQKDNYMLG